MTDQLISDETERRLLTINAATLTPLVRRAIDSQTVVVTHWNREQLHGSVGGGRNGTGIYRFAGEGQDQGTMTQWSLILKVLYEVNNQTPSDSHYWKREVHVYQSGWLNSLAGSLVGPRCMGVEEYPEAYWVWLENIKDDSPQQWTLAHYGVVARHLGQLNGAYLANTPLPNWTWLSKKWMRQDVMSASQTMAQLHDALQHSKVRRLLSDDAVNKVLRLWAERETFLECLERLPQTICHFDAFRRNLFIRRDLQGQDKTVAIDWAFVGMGPVGAELASLVFVSLIFGEADAAQAAEVDKIVFESYLDGLRTAGWQGNPKHARIGFTAAVGLRQIGLLGAMVPLLEKGGPMFDEATLDIFAIIGRFIETLTDEARHLMAQAD